MSPTPTLSAAELGIDARDDDQFCVDAIRMLAIDMTNRAKSGHPGLPMGAADMAFVLWQRFLRFDPSAPDWRDRDRFVLSAGHGSALIYALLHLSGYDLTLDELRDFRQLGSRTPGHPERGITPGVEVTTGPLGQGISNAVGIALGERMVRARFNEDGHTVSSHRTFVIASDGDLMEGVSGEACSLAGHWGLGSLIVLYDANEISIDGSTALAFTENVAKRYESYGWQVLACDGHDRDAVADRIQEGLDDKDRPTLIVCRTTIGKGSPNREGTSGVHGSPLGGDETALTKAHYGWPDEPTFAVPTEAYGPLMAAARAGADARAAWDAEVAAWRAEAPGDAAAWDALWDASHSADDLLALALEAGDPGSNATRKHSGEALNRIASAVPNLVGGSADLTGSNNVWLEGSAAIGPSEFGQAATDDLFVGRNLHFGVREHAMGAIQNGLAAHGAFQAYGATFLAFLDYMRAPVRLAALSHHDSVFVYTHDSIGLGEDGPTHQPVEHLWTARMIPGVTVHRPADFAECAAAWADAVARNDGPTVLVLTRQKTPVLPRPDDFDTSDLLRGGYVVTGSDDPELVLIATGSEVGVAVDASERLASSGIRTRVVSMPSVELFDRQSAEYRDSVLPSGARCVAIEAGRKDGWYRFVGRDGLVLGIDGFGGSAPAPVLFDHFGLTGPKAAESILEWWNR